MSIPIEVTFHGINHSEAMETVIREKAEKLLQYYDRIQSCRVVVEAPHRRHTQGNMYQIKVEVGVPGEELVVKREAELNPHEYVAVRDAFHALQRMLTELADRRSRAARRAETELPVSDA
jgi:ribosomal subunit interface protein